MSTYRKASRWTDFKDFAQSFFYEPPKTCFLCDTPLSSTNTRELCTQCEQDYFHPELSRCPHCGKLIPSGWTECSDCREGRGPKGLDKVSSWGHYTGVWRDFIQAVKFKAQPYRIRRLARPLADWAIQTLPPPHLVVPVPMHPERLAERGFNQAEVIGSILHWELGIPLLNALERDFTAHQVGLSRKERLLNLQGAFRVPPPKANSIRGRRIWIVDDVVTTGATLEACGMALKEAGATSIFCLTLAAGQEKKTIQSNQYMV